MTFEINYKKEKKKKNFIKIFIFTVIIKFFFVVDQRK